MDDSSSTSACTSAPAPTPAFSKFNCNTCSVSYATSQEQRAHMREPWHVFNLKRRMATLPSISFLEFQEKVLPNVLPAGFKTKREAKVQSLAEEAHLQNIEKAPEEPESSLPPDDTTISYPSAPSEQSDHEADSSSDTDAPSLTSTATCLFCPANFATTSENLTHMQTIHNFIIPHMTQLTDLESFLGYLSQVVTVFRSCLWCGKTKQSVRGIRMHMRELSHCKVAVDEEFGGFWDFGERPVEEEESEGEAEDEEDQEDVGQGDASAVVAPRAGLFLPSGKELSTPTSKPRPHRAANPSRHPLPTSPSTTPLRLPSRQPHPSTPATPATIRTTSLTRRTEALSLSGLLPSEQLTLRAVERRMLKIEKRARGEYEWAIMKATNAQRYFKVGRSRAPGLIVQSAV